MKINHNFVRSCKMQGSFGPFFSCTYNPLQCPKQFKYCKKNNWRIWGENYILQSLKLARILEWKVSIRQFYALVKSETHGFPSNLSRHIRVSYLSKLVIITPVVDGRHQINFLFLSSWYGSNHIWASKSHWKTSPTKWNRTFHGGYFERYEYLLQIQYFLSPYFNITWAW